MGGDWGAGPVAPHVIGPVDRCRLIAPYRLTRRTAYTAVRHMVFRSPIKEIVFDSGDIRLAGTLSKLAIVSLAASLSEGNKSSYWTSCKPTRMNSSVLRYFHE